LLAAYASPVTFQEALRVRVIREALLAAINEKTASTGIDAALLLTRSLASTLPPIPHKEASYRTS
jgi:hypothetical protein